jgi:hypothetical protein
MEKYIEELVAGSEWETTVKSELADVVGNEKERLHIAVLWNDEIDTAEKTIERTSGAQQKEARDRYCVLLLRLIGELKGGENNNNTEGGDGLHPDDDVLQRSGGD